MNAERWARITVLFDEALEQPTAAREAWLAARCPDESLAREVRAMLEAYRSDPDFMEQPVDAVAGLEAVALDQMVGRRLGAYRLERQIGRGGMGIVYEARRDDQEFDRRAAIKLLPEWSAAPLAERFTAEQRVLAGLDHPGIARLLDAGTTDGIPYFVMEYVDGLPLDAWCRAHAADLPSRVRIFERVCDAVAYAHQHLVVHRDLKPANILVTADGQPKLLDFGIATLLTEERGASLGLTRTGLQSFTPEFASPEQVRGERVTTATDVYSLGVLLHVLLTGQHPYPLQGLSPLEAMRTICDVEPPRPSTVSSRDAAAALRGDLDAIILKALRKAPGERYATVAALSGDLHAWREGRPITAAPASRLRDLRRFVVRHRLAAGAGLAVAIAVLAGGGTALWQARVARQERDKAQNRFAQVREFSRALLFDVHSALQNVPGSTESRRLLLDRAVQFLDGLAADAGDDDALKLELVEGYRRLADVQGSQLSANVGDSKAALVSLASAARLVDDVRARHPDDPHTLIAAIGVHFNIAVISDTRGTPSDASRTHRALVEALEAQHPELPAARRAIAEGYSDIGRLLVDRGKFAEGQRAYETAVARFESMPASEREAASTQYAYALKRLGAVLLRAEAFEASEVRYRAALDIEEATLRTLPAGDLRRYDITFTLSDLALVQSRRGHWADAVTMWQRALDIRKAISDADPKNVRALTGVATLLGRLALGARAEGDLDTAISRGREELRLREQLVAVRGVMPATRADRAWAALRLAESLTDRSDGLPAGAARAMRGEALALVRGTTDEDGTASVPAGSQPDFVVLRKGLLARLGGAASR